MNLFGEKFKRSINKNLCLSNHLTMDPIMEILAWNKFIDSTAVVNSTSLGTVISLNDLAQGIDYNQRVGRTICMKAIRLRFQYQPIPGTLMSDQRLRICLILDSQPNLAPGTYADIFQSVSTFSPENFNNRKRFLFLKDWIFSLGRLDNTAGQAVSSALNNDCVDMYMPLDINATYGSPSNTPESGNLLFTILSSVGSFNAQVSYWSRIYFTDR